MKKFLPVLTAFCMITGFLSEANAQLGDKQQDKLLQALFIPEISLIGNNEEIKDGDSLPSIKDNTHFGNVGLTHREIKEFFIENSGPSSLVISDINFTGENAAEFTLAETPAYPINIESNKRVSIQVVFTPKLGGTRSAILNIINNDIDESLYNVRLEAEATFTTDIKILASLVDLKVYPNPSKDIATIEITSEEQQPVVIHVYNLQGQEVLSVKERIFSKGNQRFDIATADLINGLYYIVIVSNKGQKEIKMAVLH